MNNLSTDTVWLDKNSLVFYPARLNDNMIEVSSDQHEEALRLLNAGGSISIDDNDQLIITHVDPTAVATAQNQAALAQYRANIQSLLDRSDKVCMRCTKKGLPFPTEWQTWDDYLRSEISNDDADPSQPLSQTQPAYPAGT